MAGHNLKEMVYVEVEVAVSINFQFFHMRLVLQAGFGPSSCMWNLLGHLITSVMSERLPLLLVPAH